MTGPPVNPFDQAVTQTPSSPTSGQSQAPNPFDAPESQPEPSSGGGISGLLSSMAARVGTGIAGIERGVASAVAHLPSSPIDATEMVMRGISGIGGGQSLLQKSPLESIPIIHKELDAVHSVLDPITNYLQAGVNKIFPTESDMEGQIDQVSQYPALDRAMYKGGDVVGNIMGAYLMSKTAGAIMGKPATSKPVTPLDVAMESDRAAATLAPIKNQAYADLYKLPDVNVNIHPALDRLANDPAFPEAYELAVSVLDPQEDVQIPKSITSSNVQSGPISEGPPEHTFDTVTKMSPEELESAASIQRNYERTSDVQALGEEGAAKYNAAQRTVNSSYGDPNSAKYKNAQQYIDDIEKNLTPNQRKLLFGEGQTGYNADELREFSRVANQYNPGNLSDMPTDDLYNTVGREITTGDPLKDPASAIRLRESMAELAKRGEDIGTPALVKSLGQRISRGYASQEDAIQLAKNKLEQFKSTASTPTSTTSPSPTTPEITQTFDPKSGQLPVNVFDYVKRYLQRKIIAQEGSISGLKPEDADRLRKLLRPATDAMDQILPQVPDPENPAQTVPQYAMTRQLGMNHIQLQQGADLLAKGFSTDQIATREQARGRLSQETADLAKQLNDGNSNSTLVPALKAMINSWRFKSLKPLGVGVNSLVNTLAEPRENGASLADAVVQMGQQPNGGKAFINIVKQAQDQALANPKPGYAAGQLLKYLPYATVKSTGVMDQPPAQ